MPYLHWETDRQREKIARFLDKETEEHRKKKETLELRQKVDRQRHRGDLVIPRFGKPGKSIQQAKLPVKSRLDPVSPGVARTVTTGFMTKLMPYPRLRRHLQSRLFRTENGRVLAGTEIGQVLFDAATLYEAMTGYRDKMFISKYLHADPPLHPRRTLDQAYYWTLKTTRTRDRDQVVYRGTRPNPEHAIDPKTRTWDCPEVHPTPAGGFKEEVQEPGSTEEVLDWSHCIQCRSHIRKVSRILMVDQLWMWILDEKTIITSFPRRYGVNKQDPSGVHKSIRTRLEALRSDHIRTVFDLALIILDECSNTFFDRTKTAVRIPYLTFTCEYMQVLTYNFQDRQPQVLDIFSQAIGNIVCIVSTSPSETAADIPEEQQADDQLRPSVGLDRQAC